MISQTFLPLLTGKSSALFLPRYAFGAMTEEQVSNQFLVHEKWARSLTALPLAPLVFHLDQKRIEHCNDGTSIERSTREWAATLTFPDGTPGLCDVVNGTAEKKAYLLSPTNFSEYAKEQLRQYRLRLSPPSRREARFRDNVPDLPDIIHIKTAIHSNVSFMEDLLKSDAWNPPHGSKSHAVNSGIRTNATSKPNAPTYPQARNAWAMPPKLSAQQSQKTSGTLPSGGDDSVTLGSGGENSIGTAERSTASTQSTTLASESPYHARLRELENVTKTKLKVLEETSRDSANKLQSLEKQLGRLDNMDKQMETVQEDLKSVARKLEESMESQHGISDGLLSFQKHSQKQFEDMGSHLVTAVENVNTLTGAMSDIKIEFAKMSQFMQDLASRQQVSPPALESCHRNNHRKVQLHVNDAAAQSQPSSSCDTSLGSAHSKQSHDSDTNSSAVSDNSKASSTLRSPPPKRTREGRVLEQNDSMIIEHHEANCSLAHDADGQSNEVDDGSASGSGSKVVVNLENRFSGVPLMQVPVDSGRTPRLSSDTYQQSPDIPSPSTAAPLDSQYTPSHGPDGAGGE
ncbi:hypothetical protein MHU86_22425 [Fragilaria crotonensis]|nr:hypothetical protein MHU86_22425 [Fragilaria crotonensis]